MQLRMHASQVEEAGGLCAPGSSHPKHQHGLWLHLDVGCFTVVERWRYDASPGQLQHGCTATKGPRCLHSALTGNRGLEGALALGVLNQHQTQERKQKGALALGVLHERQTQERKQEEGRDEERLEA